jgi:AcrR family transcriptional regulator
MSSGSLPRLTPWRRRTSDDLRLLPSKEDILFSPLAAVKEALAQALATRPDGQDALDTVREFILAADATDRSELDTRGAAEVHRIVESDETLRNHLRARLAQLEELIAAAIAEDLSASENDLPPQIVAASLTAAMDVISVRGGPKPDSADEVAALIDPVMAFLRGGLDTLKEPTAKPRP